MLTDDLFRAFIKARPALKISVIERECKLPLKTLDHVIRERRSHSRKWYRQRIQPTLEKYGFLLWLYG